MTLHKKKKKKETLKKLYYYVVPYRHRNKYIIDKNRYSHLK